MGLRALEEDLDALLNATSHVEAAQSKVSAELQELLSTPSAMVSFYLPLALCLIRSLSVCLSPLFLSFNTLNRANSQ